MKIGLTPYKICLAFWRRHVMSTSGKDNLPGHLSLEQEFKLQVVRDQVSGLSLEQAQEYVVEVMRQMMVKDNLVKHLLRSA